MKPPPKDLAASVRQRLLNRSGQERLDFQLVLTRYGIERLLYRLSCAPERDRFVLKGAMLFSVWAGWSPRSTRDVDLLGRGAYTPEALTRLFADLCRLAVEPDGLIFLPETVQVAPIREAQAYGGQRVRLDARLEQARIDVQIDIGFGDATVPPPTLITFPTLLDLPAPRLLAYSKETTIAEKFEALVTLGLTNTRLKDFYDLWSLARQFDFDGPVLTAAIHATFDRRQTALPAELPPALTPLFAAERGQQIRWGAFLNKQRWADQPPPLAEVIPLLAAFLGPVSAALVRQEPFDQHWPAGGPWQASG